MEQLVHRMRPAIPMEVFEKQDVAITAWAGSTRQKILMSASQFKRGKKGKVQRRSKFGVVRDEEKLVRSLKSRIRKQSGIIDSISYRFERHGVFVHKGVGNGYKMINGLVVRVAKSKTPNPRPRVPVDWFNIVIDTEVPKLANQLATINADASINALRMRIN